MKPLIALAVLLLCAILLVVAAVESQRTEQSSTERACAALGGVLVMGVEPRMQRCVKEVKP